MHTLDEVLKGYWLLVTGYWYNLLFNWLSNLLYCSYNNV